MMEAYISRYKDENVMSILEDVKHNSEYGCADPRLHSRAREAVTRFTNIATERPKDIKKTSNPCKSSSMITLKSIMRFLMLSYFNYQLLAMRYLGAGLLQTEHLDHDYPHRSTKSLSSMFWNLGNWNRKAHSKCPLPEHLEKFRPHIKFDLNTEHRPIGDKSLYNNSLSLLSRTSRLTCF